MDTQGTPLTDDPFAPDNVVPLRRPRFPFPSYGPCELEAMPEAQVSWVARGLLAHRCVTELTGDLKAGKTTFFAELARAMREGRPFLGQPTTPARITWLTEQPTTSFRETLRRAQLLTADAAEISIIFRHDVTKIPWPALIRAVVDEDLKAGGGGVLVVDTLSRLVGLGPDQENDPAVAARAMDPLLDAAKAGMAIQVHRHARKSGGDVATAGRGSSAWSADVDVMLLLRRAPRPDGDRDDQELSNRSRSRIVEAASRFSETPGQEQPCTILLTADGYGLVGDTAQRQHFDDIDEQILLYVASHPGCTKREIRETAHIRGKATARDDRVALLTQEGKLREETLIRPDSAGRNQKRVGYFVTDLA